MSSLRKSIYFFLELYDYEEIALRKTFAKVIPNVYGTLEENNALGDGGSNRVE